MPDEAADIGAGEVEPEELREPAPELLFGLPVRRSHGQVVLLNQGKAALARLGGHLLGVAHAVEQSRDILIQR